MRRRLDLAASMIGRPSVLYLDEPTTGLDPRTRNEVWDEVKRMVAEGATVLLTTQYMEEAEQLGERAHGHRPRPGHRRGPGQRAEGQGRRRTLQIRPADPGELNRMVGAHRAGRTRRRRRREPPTWRRALVNVPIVSDEQLTAVVGLLGERDFAIAGIDTHLPSLDEVFLAITGQKTSTPEDTRTDSDKSLEEVAA